MDSHNFSHLRQRTADPNWDDMRAEAVPSAAWDCAERFVSVGQALGLTPIISAGAAGIVSIEWRGDKQFYVEISPDLSVSWQIDDGEYQDGTVDDAEEALLRAFGKEDKWIGH